MENEIKPELEQEQIEEPGGAEEEAQKPEEKKELTPEQVLGRKRRTFSELAKELGVEVERPWVKKPEPQAEPAEKKEFNDADLLLLDVKQIPEEDRDWLLNEVKTTGKNLRQFLSTNFAQGELRGRAQARASQNAIPEGNNRAGAQAGGTAESWLARIESGKAKLSDVPDFKIKSEIVKLREARDKSSRGFSF